MTATDQDEAAEQAARYLAKCIRGRVPESLWADPLTFAREYWTEARTEGHWRCMPPDPKLTRAIGSGDGTPPTDEFKAVKAAITRKDGET